MNINPFILLISNVISIYLTGFIVWIVLTWLINFKIINEYQPLVRKMTEVLNRIYEPHLAMVRKVFPPIAGIDLSPLVVILLLNFIKQLLFTYFYKM